MTKILIADQEMLDREMLEAHTQEAQSLGVSQTIGLFQEWKATQNGQW